MPRVKQQNPQRHIRRLKKTTNDLMGFLAFYRLVKEITTREKRKYRIHDKALLVLQSASEDYLVSIFKEAQFCAGVDKSNILKAKHMKLARRLG